MMNRLFSLVFIFLMLLSKESASQSSASVADVDKTVGIDIPYDDIVDFYYTYDASTAVPYYRRYRFCVENGTHYFYHETREGGGWPQTEADITSSGTIALMDEQWAAFCGLLNGGSARKREKLLNDLFIQLMRIKKQKTYIR